MSLADGIVTVALHSTTPDFVVQTTGNGNMYVTNVPKISCTGCNLWVLGYKTEKSTPNLSLTNGKAEILGGYFYPLEPQFPNNSAINLRDSNLFATFMLALYNQWPNLITETQTQGGAVTRRLINPHGAQFPDPGITPSDRTYLGMFYSNGYKAPPQ